MYSPQMQVQQCITLPQPVRPPFKPPASTLSPSFSRDLKSIKIAQSDPTKTLENGRWYFFGDVFTCCGKYIGETLQPSVSQRCAHFATCITFCRKYVFVAFNQSQSQFIFVFELIPPLLVVILKERAATVAELDTAIVTDLDKEIWSNV